MPAVHDQGLYQVIDELTRRVELLERRQRPEEPSAYRVVQENGVPVPQREILNFVTAAVADNPTVSRTDVT